MVRIDGWIAFDCGARAATLLRELRAALSAVLAEMIERPPARHGRSERAVEVVSTIQQLFASEPVLAVPTPDEPCRGPSRT